MPVKTFRPLTPSSRYVTIASFDEITKDTPEPSLISIRKKQTGGRKNCYGRVTARGIGGGHKQFLSARRFPSAPSSGLKRTDVLAIEYDPIRTALLALFCNTRTARNATSWLPMVCKSARS